MTVHQALLSTVIDKQTIFAQFGHTAPIAAILRTLEAGIDVSIRNISGVFVPELIHYFISVFRVFDDRPDSHQKGRRNRR